MRNFNFRSLRDKQNVKNMFPFSLVVHFSHNSVHFEKIIKDAFQYALHAVFAYNHKIKFYLNFNFLSNVGMYIGHRIKWTERILNLGCNGWKFFPLNKITTHSHADEPLIQLPCFSGHHRFSSKPSLWAYKNGIHLKLILQ